MKPHNSDLFHLDGYNHEFLIRNQKTGGGVSLYIDESIDYKIRTDLCLFDDIAECIWIEIDRQKIGSPKNIILGCLYRIPGQNPDLFNTYLSSTLTSVSRENKTIYHTGDYNLDLIKHDTHPPTNEFLNINFALSLNPKINKPTRITPTTATLLDNLFTNQADEPTDIAGIIPIDISDHLPICFVKHFHEIDEPPTPHGCSTVGT